MENRYYVRKWLNSKEGTAFIECFASNDLSHYKDFTFKIADCNKSVSIDLGFNNVKTKTERLKKICVIINELMALKTVMERVEVKK